MELKARLASLEHQINSLQDALSNDENFKNNFKFNDDNLKNKNTNLKSILMSKKHSRAKEPYCDYLYMF
jgi:hypothetical protein